MGIFDLKVHDLVRTARWSVENNDEGLYDEGLVVALTPTGPVVYWWLARVTSAEPWREVARIKETAFGVLEVTP